MEHVIIDNDNSSNNNSDNETENMEINGKHQQHQYENNSDKEEEENEKINNNNSNTCNNSIKQINNNSNSLIDLDDLSFNDNSPQKTITTDSNDYLSGIFDSSNNNHISGTEETNNNIEEEQEKEKEIELPPPSSEKEEEEKDNNNDNNKIEKDTSSMEIEEKEEKEEKEVVNNNNNNNEHSKDNTGDKTSRSNSINSSSNSSVNNDKIYLLRHPLSISPMISPKISHSNTTTTTTTTTTTSTTNSNSNNGTPKSYFAQPTIAILPDFNLSDEKPPNTSSTTAVTNSSSSNSINSSINSSSGGSSLLVQSPTQPQSPTVVSTTDSQASPANSYNVQTSPNINNQNKAGGFFTRMFRREQSKTALPSPAPNERRSDTITTTSSNDNNTTTTDNTNSILNKISQSLQSLPKSANTSSSNLNNNNRLSGGPYDIPDNISNSSSSINNLIQRRSKGDFSRLLKENEIYSYEHFLSKLENTLPIKSSIDSFIRTLKNRRVANDDLREALLDFVDNMQNTLTLDPQWSNSSPEELNYSSHHLQQYVLEKIYDYVFQPSEEEVKKNQDLSLLIDKLSFITLEHLEIPIYNFSEAMWDKAGKYLLKINFTQSCRHKVMYIMKCCKTILKHFSTHLKEVSGADFLLPNLIWVLLKTNPPFLHSNVIFISKFSDSSDSESIYYLTQLISAIYFIENIKPEHLKIDKREYYKLMGTSSPKISRSPSLQSLNGVGSISSNDNSPNINGTGGNVTSVLIANDNALATLVEMFPDCDTQYLVECINYIESRHSATTISQNDLVFRVTNLIAELQGYWQPSPKTKSPTNNTTTTETTHKPISSTINENNFVNEVSNGSIIEEPERISNGDLIDEDDDLINNVSEGGSNTSEGVENIIESIMNESNKLIVNSNSYGQPKQQNNNNNNSTSNTTPSTVNNNQYNLEIQKLQNLIDKRDEEILKLQNKAKQDQMEIFELKKNLQIRTKELKSFNNLANSLKPSQHTYYQTKIDELKVTEVPMLLQEYKQIFNQLKATQDAFKKIQSQQQ